jgi:hypothetical protein
MRDDDDPWAPLWSPFAEDWDDPGPPRPPPTPEQMAEMKERLRQMGRAAAEHMERLAAQTLRGDDEK